MSTSIKNIFNRFNPKQSFRSIKRYNKVNESKKGDLDA